MASAARSLPQDPLTPRGIIETAEEAAREADEHLAELTAQVLAGDDSVTQADLEKAEKQSAWAKVQAVASRSRAEKRAQQLREEQWTRLRDEVLAQAAGDDSAEVEELLAQIRPILRRALQIADQRNVAIWSAARYVERGGWSPDGVHLAGEAPTQAPGASYVEYEDGRYAYTPATSVVRALLRPLRTEIAAMSGNVGADFLNAI